MLCSTFLLLFCQLPFIWHIGSSSGASKEMKAHRTITIGAIFRDDEPDLAVNFQQAVELINYENFGSIQFNVSRFSKSIHADDSFHTNKVACEILKDGAWAIFTFMSPSVNKIMKSFASHLSIPHFFTDWDQRKQRLLNVNVNIQNHRDYSRQHVLSTHPKRKPPALSLNEQSYSFNLLPDIDALSQALTDVINGLQWKRITLLYETNNDLIVMKNLLTAASWYEDMQITVRQYVNQWSKDQRVFRDIKKFGESHFVISAKMETVHQLLRFGQTYGLLTKYYSFFIVDTNSHTLNLTQIVTTEAEVPKIFALSLLNPEGFRKSQGWKNVMVVDKVTRRISKPVRLEAALIYDGLNLLMSALKNQSEPEEEPMTVCESRARHHWGKKFLNELQKSSNQGLTGQLKFGPNAVREIPSLEIIFIQRTGIEKIGMWNHSRLTWINYPIQSERAVIERIFFQTLKVATVISPPFVMFSPSGELQGFCIDLLEELSKIVPFKYETVLLSQPNYGYLNQDGFWTGLMREIMDSSVDLVVADFTVTQERSAYIDFSVPFMHFCLTSVVYLPSQKDGNEMLIFKPFTFELWLHILIAFLGVSLLVYVLCHISRDLKADLHGRPQSPISIGDCAWFTLTCLTRRTPKRMPKCASVLFLMSVWRVFVFVIASVYTANLAALQIRIKLSPGIRKMEDLTRDTPYVFGCIVNGSTHHLLKYSKNYIHQNLWDMINGNKHSEQISNLDNALERLKKSNFVFIGESATIEYATRSNCGFQVLPITTNTEPSLSYGIGLPKGSPYLEHINNGILRLQETGKLEELRRKWWQVGAKKSCKYTEPQINRLNSKFMEFIVLFVLLLSGIIISIFLAFLEYIWTFNGLPVIIKPMHAKSAPQTGADESVETLSTSQNA